MPPYAVSYDQKMRLPQMLSPRSHYCVNHALSTLLASSGCIGLEYGTKSKGQTEHFSPALAVAEATEGKTVPSTAAASKTNSGLHCKMPSPRGQHKLSLAFIFSVRIMRALS
jgi:hypothetical protein